MLRRGHETEPALRYVEKPLVFPQSIDVNLTARCNLACTFCWGPDHLIPDGLDTKQWETIIQFFANRGTTGIVFTGGEPLLRKDLPHLLQLSKELGLEVTLSTNTLLLPQRHEEVLPFVDEIGIPLDGSTSQRNQQMRKGTARAFDSSLASLELLAKQYPHIHTTVRTVVSRQNIDDIHSIGVLLSERSHLFDRWKLYQFTPVSIGLAHVDEHYLSRSDFDSATDGLYFPELHITIYPNEQRTGRYVFVGPEGNVFGVDDSGNYQVVANFVQNDESDILFGIEKILNPAKNKLHGTR